MQGKLYEITQGEHVTQNNQISSKQSKFIETIKFCRNALISPSLKSQATKIYSFGVIISSGTTHASNSSAVSMLGFIASSRSDAASCRRVRSNDNAQIMSAIQSASPLKFTDLLVGSEFVPISQEFYTLRPKRLSLRTPHRMCLISTRFYSRLFLAVPVRTFW